MKKALSMLLLLVAMMTPGWAQEEPAEAEQPAEESESESKESEEERRWRTTFTPLLWLANNSTSISYGDRSRNFTLRAADALGNLEAGGTFRLGVSNDEWGAFADLFFIGLGDTSNVGPLGNIPLRTEVDNTVWQVAGTYRVVDKDNFDLDVLAGVRGYSIDVDVTVQPFTGPAGVLAFPGRSLSRGLSFVDPIIGGMAKWELSDKWAVDFYGDIGGFGAGSDFTYRLGTGFDYSFNDHVSARAGYTVVDFDYSTGSGFDRLRYETTLYGPNLGLQFKI